MSNRPQDDNFELAADNSESENETESIAENNRVSHRKSHDVSDRSNSPNRHMSRDHSVSCVLAAILANSSPTQHMIGVTWLSYLFI